ncbi:MAG: hypothetical protein RBT63_03950, partial [Bdellovibrionales bacterium]|nr:hypothetical protein [Bdellovibrionales bacterium]
LGCASYQHKVDEARRGLKGQPEAAVERLRLLAAETGRDQLVYTLDYATALQIVGRYEESAKTFLQAERLADEKDYHSISNVAGSLVLNEEMVQYKGDDFEKVLINGLNALNFLKLGRLEEALVETRRVNEKLYKLKMDGKKAFNQSPFAFYLGAMIWEADRKFDDAYIAYAKTYEVAPHYGPLREDLIRSALRAQRNEDAEKWKKQFPEIAVKPEWRKRDYGEVVLIFQQGWGPRKEPRPESPLFPRLRAVRNYVDSARMNVVRSEEVVASSLTTKIYSVEEIATKALDDDFARLVGARVAGVATKAVVAEQVRQKDKALGDLTWILLNLADRADLRQWSTLPATFQVARARVPKGTYRVDIYELSGVLDEIGRIAKSEDVEVKPSEKTFLVWRSIE